MTGFDGTSDGGAFEDFDPRPDVDARALEPGEAEEELGAIHAATYARLKVNATDLVATLRSDRNFRIAMARADTRPHLLEWFAEDQGWQEDPLRSGNLGQAAVGTSWTFSGIHVDEQSSNGRLLSGREVAVTGFNGLLATGRQVTVRGFTIMTAEGGKLSVHRHIDWAGLFGQLGLTVDWRVPLGGSHPDEL